MLSPKQQYKKVYSYYRKAGRDSLYHDWAYDAELQIWERIQEQCSEAIRNAAWETYYQAEHLHVLIFKDHCGWIQLSYLKRFRHARLLKEVHPEFSIHDYIEERQRFNVWRKKHGIYAHAERKLP